MCGISGIFAPASGPSREDLLSAVTQMSEKLVHRGPDGNGVWVDESNGIGLAHRRLSIIDLSEAGHQPMTSADGRYVICYNGEAYNANNLRYKLENKGYCFYGHSDTEVIVNGFTEWGVKETLKKIIGMFSIAVWDKHRKIIYLIRDRLGIKPLYWTKINDILLFSSEIKSLHTHKNFTKNVNLNSAQSYFNYGYINSPHTIFKETFKLKAGEIISFDENLNLNNENFWSLEEKIRFTPKRIIKNKHSIDTAIRDLQDIVRESVKCRMIADVPIGSFLSGGIDSSLVTAVMQEHSPTPVKSFSIGFEEDGYNEANHARKVSQHIGTDHHELYVTDNDARELIPALVEYYDEPFGDPSQIPTLLLSKMTREHVTVALSGDGGDEVFGGYTRYKITEVLNRRINLLPYRMRHLAAVTVKTVPASSWENIFKLLPQKLRPKESGQKAHRLAEILQLSGDKIYNNLVSQWHGSEELVIGGSPLKELIWDRSLELDFPDIRDRMQFIDTVTYLPDDILTKVDRASMASSLEARVPLLDHRLVEFAWSLPQSLKLVNGEGKWILKQLLYKYIPQDLVDRPKMGFGVPIGQWIRGPLYDWTAHTLSENELKRHGILNPETVQSKLKDHLEGRKNWEYLIWNTLIFQSWCNRWL